MSRAAPITMPPPPPVVPSAGIVTVSGSVPQGILLMAAAMLVIPGIDAIAKGLTGVVYPSQIAWSRFLFQSLLLLPCAVVALTSAVGARNVGPLWIHAGRGALIALATLMFFSGVQVMPIADSIAIFFIEPLLLTILSALLLKEAIGWRRIAAVLAGFAGAMLIVQPGFGAFGWTVLYPVGTAFAFSLYMILTRILAEQSNPLVMQFLAGVFGCATMSIALSFGTTASIPSLTFVWPEASTWALLALLGVIATGAHILVVFALKFAPASVIAPFQYLEIIGATLLGFAFFGDFPSPLTWVGIAIIVSSGLFVFYREQRGQAEQ